MRNRVELLVVGLLLLLPQSSARAFSYEEHCRISNRAVWLAIHQVIREHGSRLTQARADSLRTIAKNAADARCDERYASRAYGHLVSRVDWAVTPGDFFLAPLSGTERRSTGEFPGASIQALIEQPLQSFRLLHENAEHFGARAWHSYRTWHRQAMALARDGEIDIALVYNAFADHYLEDLFAPGHIFSPRGGMNDALAGGMHAAYNRRGARFYPSGMRALASYVAILPQGDPNIEREVRMLLMSVCEHVEWSRCVANFDGDTLTMHGDNLLRESPRQELYVMLVVARSVSDLLETWIDPAARRRDSLAPATWCDYHITNYGSPYKWDSPAFSFPFGAYGIEAGAGLPWAETWPTLRAGVQAQGGRASRVVGAAEVLKKAWPGYWVGAPPGAGFLSALRAVRTTHWGVDVAIPTDSALRYAAFGPYIRGSADLVPINTRTSWLGGGRYEFATQSTEIHGSVGLELGFALVHLEMRPGILHRWGDRRGWSGTFDFGAAFTPPIPLNRPRLGNPPESKPLRTCGGSQVLVP